VRRVAIGVLSVLILLTGVLIAPAQANPAPKRILSGWIPYWMSSQTNPVGINSAVQNADLFVDVSPFWYSALAKPGGGVRLAINPNFGNGARNIQWAMQQLRGAGLTILPAIADGSGKGRMATALADPAQRTTHVNEIVELVMSNGFDGIDLDYEAFAFSDGSSTWAATQPNWTAFVVELSAALRAQGKQLAITIPGPCNTRGECGGRNGYWVYNHAAIAPYADRIRIMAYDYSFNGIGPIAPINWVTQMTQYMASIMPADKVQMGVPTYGRSWTQKTSSGAFRLVGNCPTNSGSTAQRAAYRSLTAMASATDAAIPGILAAAGVPASAIRWDERYQESVVEFDKNVTWQDAAGTQQTCTAKRIMWFVGPQAVLARTTLVGTFGINAAAYWTIGGEDPSQWPMLRTYAQSLAPATSDVALTGPSIVTFGTPAGLTAVLAADGQPIPDIPLTLQFRPTGSKGWTDVSQSATGPDGTTSFAPQVTASGAWRVVAPAVNGRQGSASEILRVSVASQVRIVKAPKRLAPKSKMTIVTRALPAQSKQRLRLEINQAGTWRPIEVVRANAKGRAKFVVQAPQAKARYTYRVIALKTKDVAAGESAQFRVRIR
jgi:spore germination protein YaaH